MAPRLLAVALVLVSAPAAADDDVGYQLESSVASNYVVRGMVQYTTRRVPSSQNLAALTFHHLGDGDLTLLAWNATALSDFDAQPGNALELDLAASYAIHRDALALTGTYMVFLYPDHMAGAPLDAAHELWGVASYETAHVTPIAGVYGEVVRMQGVYVMAGATHDYKLGAWTVTPTVSAGAAAYRKYLGGEQSAPPHINDVTGSVVGRLDIADGVYATAKVSYSLRGTPSELVPMMGWGFDGRSSIFGALAIGIAR